MRLSGGPKGTPIGLCARSASVGLREASPIGRLSRRGRPSSQSQRQCFNRHQGSSTDKAREPMLPMIKTNKNGCQPPTIHSTTRQCHPLARWYHIERSPMKMRYFLLPFAITLAGCASTIGSNSFPRSDIGLNQLAHRIITRGDSVRAARDALREHGFTVEDGHSADYRQGILRWPYGENAFEGSRQEQSYWPIRFWSIVVKHDGERVIDVQSDYRTEHPIFDM